MPTEENAPRPSFVARMRANPGALAAYAVLLLVVAFTLVWRSQRESIAHPDFVPSASAISITPPPPGAVPVASGMGAHEREARDLRRLAFIAYEDDRYAETLEYLDRARRVDPEGDQTEKVQTARRYCESQLKEKNGSAQAAPKN